MQVSRSYIMPVIIIRSPWLTTFMPQHAACIIRPALTAVNQKIQKRGNKKSASHFNWAVKFYGRTEERKKNYVRV